MKTLKQTAKGILSLLLVISVLLGCNLALASCTPVEGGDTDTTVETDGLPDPEAPVVLSSGGKGIYRIVRREVCTSQTMATFKSVIRYLNTELGAGMEIYDDWLMPDVEPSSVKEILIGNADREECRAVLEATPFDGYTIRATGNKVIIAAHNDELLAEAAEKFKTMVTKNENGDIVMSEFRASKSGGGSFVFGAENSLSDYKIVRAGWASDNAATQLASKLKSTYGAELPVVTDSEPETECEFVIGVTNRGTAGTEAGKMTGAYSKFGYMFFTVGKKIFICGGDDSDSANAGAVNKFIEEFITPKLTCVFNLSAELNESGLCGMDSDVSLIEGADTRVMSFNILSEEWDAAAKMTGRDYRVAATILHYSPDVAGIQEISELWYSRLTTLIGSEYAFVGKKIPSGSLNYTGLIYNKNKVKLIENGMTVFAVGNSPRLRLLNWGVFESLESGKQYIVCNTHWDANHTGDHTPVRVQQATEMAGLVNGLIEKYKLPVFCCGDYNCNEESEPYATFMSMTGFKDPKYTAKTITNPTKTTHALGSAASSAAGVCIDHILVSPDMEILYYTTLIGSFWTSVSDHCPIYIDFKLP